MTRAESYSLVIKVYWPITKWRTGIHPILSLLLYNYNRFNILSVSISDSDCSILPVLIIKWIPLIYTSVIELLVKLQTILLMYSKRSFELSEKFFKCDHITSRAKNSFNNVLFFFNRWTESNVSWNGMEPFVWKNTYQAIIKQCPTFAEIILEAYIWSYSIVGFKMQS